MSDPRLPLVLAELREWEAAGLIAKAWEVEEIDGQLAGMLGELRNHLSPTTRSGVEPRWFLVTRTPRGVRSIRVFDHEDPAKQAFESEERWVKANPEHGVDCALFGATHLSQIVVAHTEWFDPRPAGPPPASGEDPVGETSPEADG
ncbi:MAG: hypothetical protein QOH12_1971 [Solirubrobacteraceae bacterium]|jgi:hypothetical protein|nr:hypothetical protein [Solirubrobacteraceae bacterium]